jgi:phenylpyruvate tautomerase
MSALFLPAWCSAATMAAERRLDMPLIKLQIAPPVPDEMRSPLLTSASRIVAEATGKPETYVMAILEPAIAATMAGQATQAAFVDVRGIGGINASVNRAISKGICDLLQKQVGLAPDHVYLNFTDVPAANWGWDARTFG